VTIASLPGGTGTYYVNVTSGGANNTKGAYVELIAATAFDANRIVVTVIGQTAALRSSLVDVATGAAGVESVLAANLFIVGHTGDFASISSATYDLYANIPSGTRLSVRSQCSIASTAMRVNAMLVSGSGSGFPTPETYGAVTASSTGTPVNAGAVANTKGAWTELTPATSITISSLAIAVNYGLNNAPGFNNWQIDIGVGASGSEVVVVPDYSFGSGDLQALILPAWITVPVSIVSGSRLAARLASTTIDATDRILQTIAIGMGYPTTGSTAGATSYPFLA